MVLTLKLKCIGSEFWNDIVCTILVNGLVTKALFLFFETWFRNYSVRKQNVNRFRSRIETVRARYEECSLF